MVWNNDVTTSLGSTAAGESTRANGVNYDGTVIAGWQDGNGRQGAFWVDGIQTLIFDNSNSPVSEAADVSSDGRFVIGGGIGSFGGGVGTGYRYDTQSDSYLDIDNLSSGGQMNFAATSITDDGSVIGGGTWPFALPASFGIAIIWEEGKGTMPVQDYLISKGFSEKDWGAGFNFNFVTSISSDGKWISGWGGTGPAANQSWVARIQVDLLIGDVNCDGNIDLLDVAPFVDAITSSVFNSKADINFDGVVDLLDVGPFVELLTN